MRKFLRFLKDNNIYYNYWNNFYRQNYPLMWYNHNAKTNINRYFCKTPTMNYISGAFFWQYTLEGDDFWESFHIKWLKLTMGK